MLLCYTLRKPLFDLGEILISQGVQSSELDVVRYLRRHQSGDFGDVDPEDAEENLRAIHSGEGVVSQYQVSHHGRTFELIIVTESDRSYTIAMIAGEPMPGADDYPEQSGERDPDSP
jgi:hypothetical protein